MKDLLIKLAAENVTPGKATSEGGVNTVGSGQDTLVDNITNSMENTFVLLANKNNSNVNIICKTNITSDKIHCGNIVREICQKCSGNGGGNQFFAQGGGSNAQDLSKFLEELKEQFK